MKGGGSGGSRCACGSVDMVLWRCRLAMSTLGDLWICKALVKANSKQRNKRRGTREERVNNEREKDEKRDGKWEMREGAENG